MTHPDGLEVDDRGDARREGISDADIDLMMRKNPARLLGLYGHGRDRAAPPPSVTCRSGRSRRTP